MEEQALAPMIVTSNMFELLADDDDDTDLDTVALAEKKSQK